MNSPSQKNPTHSLSRVPSSMDEVWNDLSLSSLLHHATSAAPPPPGHDPPLIQQFLPYATTSKTNITENLKTISSQPESTMITNPPDSYSLTPYNTFMCPHSGGNRVGDENVLDRKRKRLMKNRESAARSRARRQAYTYELESEVAHLMEENAKLRKQVEKLRVAAPGLDQNPKQQKLHRTLSNPI